MTIFVLLIVIFTKDGPATIDKIFPDKFDCQVAEGVILTAARDEQKIIGWQVPAECLPVEEANKV